jgi:hypothetical protein
LPSADPDGEGAGLEIVFRYGVLGTVTAVLFDEDGMMHDQVRAHSMQEAYDAVRAAYPQAMWDGPDSEEDTEDVAS